MIVKNYFMVTGKSAPKTSSFKGIVSAETIFGSRSLFNYHDRKDATIDSNHVAGESLFEIKTGQGDSLMGYTGRGNATENSQKDERYFTQTSSGRLYTEEDRLRFADENRGYLEVSGKPIWEFIVSLDSYEFARDHHCQTQEDWAAITDRLIPKIAKAIGINPINLVYWEDFHTNTDNPHIHLTFFEKNLTRTRGKIPDKTEKYIKTLFVTEVVGRDLFKEKNGISVDEYLKTTKKKAHDELVTSIKSVDYRLCQGLADLYAKLPTTGRLQYNSYQMKPYKEELDSVITSLLQMDGVKEKYDEFLQTFDVLEDTPNEIMKGKIATMREAEIKKLYTVTGNYLLNIFKTMDGAKSYQQLASLKKFKWTTDDETLQSMITAIRSKTNLTKSDEKFLLAAEKYLNNDHDPDALMQLQTLAAQGQPEAKHFENKRQQSVPITKSTLPSISRSVRKTERGLKRTVSEQKAELDSEIRQFLQENPDYYSELSRKNQIELEANKA